MVGLALVLSLILNLFLFQQNRKLNQGMKVIGVIDGDTLVLDGKTRLRLRLLDAPELEYCGGPEAKEQLDKLVSGQQITIQEKILDQQGRAMSLVYVGKTLVNLEMIKSGWARYHHDNSAVAEELKQAGETAKEAKLGIYSPKCLQTENVDQPECVIKGNLDKNSGRKLYYLPDCAQYKFTLVEKDIGEDWYCTPEEAEKAGFTKAKSCP